MPRCVWQRQEINDEQFLEWLGMTEPPSPEAYIVQERCREGPDDCTDEAECPYDQPQPNYDWADPSDGDGDVVTEEDLEDRLYSRLELELQAPVLSADPPVGDPVVVDLPTFVYVENWVDGPFGREECDGGLCVQATVTPSLDWDPREPGAPTVECEGPGSRYDPAGPPAEEQAAPPGTCAYAYQLRTANEDGLPEDRPRVWPGVVTVTWEVAWADGSIDVLTASTDLPRDVNEVQAVVAD